MKAVGMEGVKGPTPEDDDMARYTICGDVYGDAAARQVFGEENVEMPEVEPQPPSVPTKPTSPWIKAAMFAAVLAAGVGIGISIPWFAGWLASQPPVADAPVDTTTQIEVE